MDAQETYLTGTAFGHLRCRDQLRHSVQVIGTLSLPRVEGRAVQARGGGGQRGGARARARRAERAGAGAPAAGPNSPRTRLSGGARLRVCNARAPRPECVPAFPFLPRRSCGQTEPRAPAEAPGALSGSTAGRTLAAARSGSGAGD